MIILDEPTRGVDVGAKFEIYRLMRQLNDRGIAIVMISSELPEIIGMSDRIMVMNDGRVAGELPREEAGEARIIELATMGAPRGTGRESPGERRLRQTQAIGPSARGISCAATGPLSWSTSLFCC